MIQHDQLIGLCNEIAALVRLNLPLEKALRYRSEDLPVRLGNRVQELATRLESGRLLSEALREAPDFPPVYAAVVEAGLESGNLTGALEYITKNLQILRDSRNFLQGAMLYPMFVFTVLWLIFSFVTFKCTMVFIDFYNDFSFKLTYLETLSSILNYWDYRYCILDLLVVPVFFWGVYIFWCFRSKYSTLLTFRTPLLFFWLRTANRNLTRATFAQIVAMLIRSGLPLPRTLLLSFQAIGISVSESELEQRFHEVKNRQLSGEKKYLPLNHLVNWILGVTDQTVLLSGLDQYAELHTFQAENNLKRIEFWLPVLLLFLLGGLVMVAYFLAIIFPYGYLLYQLCEL
ncbi:MAG: type II secretion system F family protein [Planctomycetaceae bacterium]|jgi:type II secretory pathway component PulF|nr:type II secretion system F family protein [Planctomycetaceae bacterium]